MDKLAVTAQKSNVLPLAREWIEIVQALCFFIERKVLPLAREWIEIKIKPL